MTVLSGTKRNGMLVVDKLQRSRVRRWMFVCLFVCFGTYRDQIGNFFDLYQQQFANVQQLLWSFVEHQILWNKELQDHYVRLYCLVLLTLCSTRKLFDNLSRHQVLHDTNTLKKMRKKTSSQILMNTAEFDKGEDLNRMCLLKQNNIVPDEGFKEKSWFVCFFTSIHSPFQPS